MDKNYHKVIIVDDDPAILYLCSLCLSTLRVSVAMARNVLEARKMLARKEYDLLITDYEMPRFTGLDLVLGLRNAGNLIPVILMSGTPSSYHAFNQAGVSRWEFLEKPFPPEKFQTLVRKLIKDEFSCRLEAC